MQGHGDLLEPIPALSVGERQGYTLDRPPLHQRATCRHVLISTFDKYVNSTVKMLADTDGCEDEEGSQDSAAVKITLCHLGPSFSDLLQTENTSSSASL